MTETVEMLVCPSKGSPYELQKVIIGDDLRDDEILVRMVATGVCATDFATTNVSYKSLVLHILDLNGARGYSQ